MSDQKLKILPLGGLGEIGMNCMVFECGETMVLIDCGLQFPDSTYTGIELLLPDLNYIIKNIHKLKGVIVTHGHDDHIGAIPFLLKHTELDVYITPFPKGLLENKLVEFPGHKEIRFHDINPRKKFKVGCFEFDPIPVQHSIIEALAFAIETPLGMVVHSGDFKHDPHETSQGQIGFEPFEEIGDKNVLLLMSDSTNAERTGHTLSEMEIADSFQTLLEKQTGRLLIALFASNIKRVEKILGIAHAQGKKVAFAGRSMHSYTRLAHEQNKLNIPPDTLVLIENSDSVPDNKMIVLSTGSQAEPQSALLRISEGIHKDFQIRAGDQIIMSSRFIPGNERAITKMIDQLYRQGAEVMYESVHQIHVSGHGFQDELMMMLKAVRPKYFIPIHGEYRHLSKHSKLAITSGVEKQNVLIVEDGQAVEIDSTGMRLTEKLEIQKTAVVDLDFVQANSTILKERNNLSKTGIVFVTFLCTRSGKMVGEPSISAYGLLFRNGIDPQKMYPDLKKHLIKVYNDARNREEIPEALRIETRRFLKKRTSHKPVVIPVILEV